MLMKPIKKLFLSFLTIILLSHCGGTSSSTNSNSTSTSSNQTTITSNDTNTELSFTLTLQIDADDDTFDFTVTMPDEYTVPLKVESDGTVTMYANDFPKVIYRICETSSDETDCDARTDQIGIDIDLVIDACGRFLTDASCGDSDSTQFSGTLSEDGSITIDNVAIRSRIFAITDSSDGFNADSTDSGLTSLDRIMVDITTGDVSTGDLESSGSNVDEDQNVTLVASGSVSSDTPYMGSAVFIGTITGSFDEDVLEFLE